MGGVVIRGGRGGGGGGGPSSLAVSVFNGGGPTYNLSEIGTIDWWWFGTYSPTVPLRNSIQTQSLHAKKTGGGWLRQGDGSFITNGYVLSSFNQSSSQTITADADDDTSTGVGSTTGAGLNTPNALDRIGWGFQYALPVPGDGVSRTLRIFGNQFNCDVRCTAKLIDGTTDNDVTFVANGGNSYWDVTWSSGIGQILMVDVLVDVNIGTNSNLKIQAMALF